jgi:hypothetical protein
MVSSSGVSREGEGCVESEQPLVREEGIGPALMVASAPSRTWAFLLLAQDGAQPPSDEAVDVGEHAWK